MCQCSTTATARINDAAVRGLPRSSAKVVAACADAGRAAASRPACNLTATGSNRELKFPRFLLFVF